MAKFKVIEGKTLEEYQTKYKKKLNKLVSFTKKEVKDFDEFHKDSITCENYLLEHNKWWLINDTYYQLPKKSAAPWIITSIVAVLALGGAGYYYHHIRFTGENVNWQQTFNELSNGNDRIIQVNLTRTETSTTEEKVNKYFIQISDSSDKFSIQETTDEKTKKTTTYEETILYKTGENTWDPVTWNREQIFPSSGYIPIYSTFAKDENNENKKVLFGKYFNRLLDWADKANNFTFNKSTKSFMIKDDLFPVNTGSYVKFHAKNEFEEIKYHTLESGEGEEKVKVDYLYKFIYDNGDTTKTIDIPTYSTNSVQCKHIDTTNNTITTDTTGDAQLNNKAYNMFINCYDFKDKFQSHTSIRAKTIKVKGLKDGDSLDDVTLFKNKKLTAIDSSKISGNVITIDEDISHYPYLGIQFTSKNPLSGISFELSYTIEQ